MSPISPIVEGFQDREVVYGANQPQYKPLPALRDDNYVLTRWTLTQEERDAIAAGADVFLTMKVCGQPLQPSKLSIPWPVRNLEFASGIDLAQSLGLLP